MTQTLHIHLEEYGPGGNIAEARPRQRSGVLHPRRRGYEIHDGVRYDWQAGDVAIVHNNCVHQHFNADPVKPARALVLKTKPMYLFMNMLFQKTVEPRPPSRHPAPKVSPRAPRKRISTMSHDPRARRRGDSAQVKQRR